MIRKTTNDLRKTTNDIIDGLNIAKSLYSNFDNEAENKLSKLVINQGMNEVYTIGNKVMMGVVGLHFLLLLTFAGIKNEFLVPIILGVSLLAIFYVSVWKIPHHLLTRILAGVVLQSFGLLYLYQLEAIPEIRFLFFASFTFLIVYQDIKVLYPAAFLFILQLLIFILFAEQINEILNNYPNYKHILNFIPRKNNDELDILAMSLYIGASILQALSIGLWATYLRRNSIANIIYKIKIAESQVDLAEANNDLENKINEKTKELQRLLEITQSDEEELRQNLEEIQATQDELESQRRKLLENQEVMLSTEKILKEQQKELQEQQWVEHKLNEIDEVMRQNDEKEMRLFADNVLLEVAKIVKASRAAFYLFDDISETLTMVGGYACTPETVQKNTFKIGEGIIGQVIKTKNTMTIDNIPDDGLVIESALAKIKSKAVTIIPLVYNGELQGVMELAVLQKFDELHLVFLSQVNKNIAGTLQNIRAFQTTQNLLTQSQEITSQLENNAKELEQARFKLEQKTGEYKTQFNAINKSLMVMICGVKGEILKVNEKFAQSTEYTEEELVGKHLSILFPEHVINSKNYRLLGANTKTDFFEGEYECITKNNTPFWIRFYYYNFSENNENQIMVLSYNITKEKLQEKMIKEQLDAMEYNQQLLYQNVELMQDLQYEKDAKTRELEEQIRAIDFTFATANFDTKGNIKSINGKMCEFLGYEQSYLSTKNIKDLIDINTDEIVAFPEWWSQIQENQVLEGNYAFADNEKNTVWLYGTFYPVTDAQNHLKQVMFLGIEKINMVANVKNSK